MNKQVALGFFAVLALADKAAAAVTDQKTWSQSFPVTATAPRLLIDNIWGNVRVRRLGTRDCSHCRREALRTESGAVRALEADALPGR